MSFVSSTTVRCPYCTHFVARLQGANPRPAPPLQNSFCSQPFQGVSSRRSASQNSYLPQPFQGASPRPALPPPHRFAQQPFQGANPLTAGYDIHSPFRAAGGRASVAPTAPYSEVAPRVPLPDFEGEVRSSPEEGTMAGKKSGKALLREEGIADPRHF
jgi:hypothetical protein